ncbi:hypothetical protein F5X98DRAFT_40387 [Xylaria grammica]|nr:hypothetical protein F5X98DRAFT_40387 [Xylaria grammica]
MLNIVHLSISTFLFAFIAMHHSSSLSHSTMRCSSSLRANCTNCLIHASSITSGVSNCHHERNLRVSQPREAPKT